MSTNKKQKQEIRTVWALYECARGRRWSEVVIASYCPKRDKSVTKDGDFCNFSGCLEKDHKIKIVRETEDVPVDWFRAWEPWESSPRYKSLVTK